MSMFCYQCQETAGNTGCRIRGVCGKKESTANYQDLLVHVLKGLAVHGEAAASHGEADRQAGRFIAEALFATITNANFDDERIKGLITEGLKLRSKMAEKSGLSENLPDAAVWSGAEEEWEAKAMETGVLSTENEDVRSLRELLIYGLKGIAAYADHAAVLGFEEDDIYRFLMEALAFHHENPYCG